MILWRSLGNIITSRYSAIFIIISAITTTKIIGLIQKKNQSYSKLLFVFTAVLILYNIAKTFHSFRNLFYYDIKEELSRNAKENHIDLLSIAEKDFKRIKTNDEIPRYENIINSRAKLTSEYIDKMFWNKKTLFVIHEKNKWQNRKQQEIYPYGTVSFERIGAFATDKYAKKIYNLYSYEPFLPSPAKEVFEYIKKGQLKVFNPETKTYIYQVKDKIVWAIGVGNELKKPIIYHLYTDQVDLLPDDRKPYKFDNKDFCYDEKEDKKLCQDFIVLEKEIPKNYPVSKIVVGHMKDNGTISWLKTFTID